MFRKTAFLLLAFCFLSTIAAHDVLSASDSENETPQLRIYSWEKNGNYLFPVVVRYTDSEFNLLIDESDKCTYKNICKQDGDKFICDGVGQVGVISGIITPEKLEITKTDGGNYCTANMSIQQNYEILDIRETKGKVMPITVMPLEYTPSDDIDDYTLKDKEGQDFYLENDNNVHVLDKFKNQWIDIEYFQFSFYFEPAAEYSTRNVLFRVKGKNPLAVE